MLVLIDAEPSMIQRTAAPTHRAEKSVAGEVLGVINGGTSIPRTLHTYEIGIARRSVIVEGWRRYNLTED